MPAFCLMCGQDIADGFLCEKCDRPKAPRSAAPNSSNPQPPAQSAPSKPAGSPATAAEPAFEPFPKAPVVQFPRESASPAITSICDIIAAAEMPAIVITSDRVVRFVSDDARRLLGAADGDPLTVRLLENLLGISVPRLDEPSSTMLNLNGRPVKFTVIPLTGGAGGAVLSLRPQEGLSDQTPFSSYLRETVLAPLRSLHESLEAAATSRRTDPVLQDAASTIDQILSSLELASNVEEPPRTSPHPQVPSIVRIMHQVGDQFRASARKKGVTIQIDVPDDLEETFQDHARLTSALQTLVENALHYVPQAGQVVLGARPMEFKEKQVLLFFVMDNGPVVPEEYRRSIFDPGFVWDPADPVRSGKGLAKVRQFAIDHNGQVSVESKSGKACTFFLRIRPDNA